MNLIEITLTPEFRLGVVRHLLAFQIMGARRAYRSARQRASDYRAEGNTLGSYFADASADGAWERLLTLRAISQVVRGR